jgi:hypothetical protein
LHSRLTRSLADFAKLVVAFDARDSDIDNFEIAGKEKPPGGGPSNRVLFGARARCSTTGDAVERVAIISRSRFEADWQTIDSNRAIRRLRQACNTCERTNGAP